MKRDDGFVGGGEGLLFGFFVFVLGTLVVANAWAVVDAKLAVSAAAREAARAFVEAGDQTSASIAAQSAATDALRAQGRQGGADVAIDATGFGRCSRVTVVVRYDVPLAAVPVIAASQGMFTVVGRHSEVVDPYRSNGISGLAACS